MNKNFALHLWLTALISGLVSAQDRPSLVDRFATLDRNQDGKVTSAELPRPELFQRLDRNRDGVITLDDIRRATPGKRTPEGLTMPDEPAHEAHLNLVYHSVDGVDPNLLSLDLYTPEPQGKDHPVMIMIHGGGWRGGDKANASITGAKMPHFLSHGYIYASINYRLSPQSPSSEEDQVKHPIHAQDCAKAITWIHDHIADYGGDPDQLHLMGHSAGAHLAAMIGTDHRLLEAEGKPLSIVKTNVLLDTAAIDVPGYLETVQGRGMTALYHNAFGETEEELRNASPIHHISPGKKMPPTLLFYQKERMYLHDFGSAFATAMTAAGSPSQAIDTVTLDHGQINAHVGMIGDGMTPLIMRLHAGEDPTTFPRSLAPDDHDQGEALKNTSNISIDWKQDYIAGTKDLHGAFMGGTETMRILSHEGKLYAGLSYWTDQPGNDPRPGAQIITKSGPDAPWRVSQNFPGSGRISAMESFPFSDGTSLLMADASLTQSRREGALRCLLYEEKSSTWIPSIITDQAPRAFIRAFGQLCDEVFAGTGAGEIYRGTYDPNSPHRIIWDPKPEYQNPDFSGGAYRRCQGFCVANGVLYASVAPRLLMRKEDGSWSSVFQWEPDDRAGAGLRGITAVPSLTGDHEVILGSREQEGRILLIDPLKQHAVTNELQSQDFLRHRHPEFRGGKLVAYNQFVPGCHPHTNRPIHWISVAGGLPDRRGTAWLLVRDATTAQYDIFPVRDATMEEDAYLVSTRTLAIAPWNPSEMYTGGYDGAAQQRKNHNTAWIYRGVINASPAAL